MGKGTYYRIAIVLLLSCTLSACSDPLVTEEEHRETGAESEVISELNEEAVEVTIPDAFYQLPDVIVLPPNGTLQLDVPGASFYSANSELLLPLGENEFQVSSEAVTGDRTVLTVAVVDQRKEIEVKIKYALAETIEMIDGVATVTNPSDVLVLVNKERNLPADYVPEGLMPPNIPFYFKENIEKRWMRPDAAAAIEEMFAAAKEDGIELVGASAYRSYETQKSLFNRYVKTYGLEEAQTFSARPGQSEHQTGLTIDVYHKNITNGLEESFGDTPEGQWVAEHAHEFGFIVRYPKGKEDITGYKYEPWHLRYVGKEVAKEIYERGITLEEYLSDDVFYSVK